jgi:hypothetical protein
MRKGMVWVLVAGCLGLGLLAAPDVIAQMKRPYHDGTAWTLAFIRVKPGMDAAYMNYLAGDWKREQEALKKEGMILSYKVLTTEGHSGTDWNLMLMVEYKDMATMEGNADKADSLLEKLFGGDEKVQQGYRDRESIREVLGSRLGREVILEPKM